MRLMAKLFSKENADLEISISTHSIVRVIALTFGAFLLLLAVRQSLHALTLIGVAFFLSLALDAPVRWLSANLPGKKRNKRNLATAISIGLIVVALIGFVATILPPLARQTTDFVQGLPELIDNTKNGKGVVGEFVVRHNLQGQVDKLSSQLSSRTGDIGGTAWSTLTKIGSSVFAMLTVLVLTVMMLAEGPRWRKIMEDVVPNSKHKHYFGLMKDMRRVVQGYVNGQVLLAGIAALLIVPIFFIMGVSYPIALMVIVFVCGLIPMVGHTIGAIICTMVALFTSLPAALVVLGYYILYQQIENYVVQPRIQANSTNMSPLLVFVAVLIGANFGGLLGALVSIPVMGCIRILILDYLQRRDILTPATVHDAKTKGGTI